MLRAASNAQRDKVIATGLLPGAALGDFLTTWMPILTGITAALMVSSSRGSKAAKSVAAELTSPASPTSPEPHIKISFQPTTAHLLIEAYLAFTCASHDPALFEYPRRPPTEDEVLKEMGWAPTGVTGDLADEKWEIEAARLDVKVTMEKGAKEWIKWVKAYEKNPQKALKK